jgi:hypothetical protein
MTEWTGFSTEFLLHRFFTGPVLRYGRSRGTVPALGILPNWLTNFDVQTFVPLGLTAHTCRFPRWQFTHPTPPIKKLKWSPYLQSLRNIPITVNITWLLYGSNQDCRNDSAANIICQNIHWIPVHFLGSYNNGWVKTRQEPRGVDWK